jgi:hypothetical protein
MCLVSWLIDKCAPRILKMDTTFLRTAATRQVSAGAAEFGSAAIRCSPFGESFVGTKSLASSKQCYSAKNTM